MSSSEMDIPLSVQDLLRIVPHRGQGMNLWLFRAALGLAPYRNPNQILDYLRLTTQGEPIRHGEIERAVSRAVHAFAERKAHPDRKRCSRWPDFDPQARLHVLDSGDGLVDLWECSPWRLVAGEDDPEWLIDILFPGDPWLCAGKSGKDFMTLRRTEWRGKLADQAVIVPSPMKEKFGLTQDGRRSQRTLRNTGARRFLVVEQDRGTLDEQAAVLMSLGNQAQLQAVVFSGNKSLHAWFLCRGVPENDLRKFMSKAIRLGADPATWVQSQLVRLPGGTRENGIHQAVYYLNPNLPK
jgi:hypothetical protein